MVYNLVLGLVSLMVGYFAYTSAGLDDPIKTLLAAVFFVLAVSVILDSANTDERAIDDE